MPITDIDVDEAKLTITVVAEFQVPAQRVWDAYLDPRQIERFWGPPTYPATFPKHECTPGGASHYFMTSPEGEKSWGFWHWETVNAPHSFEVLDGFALEGGDPNPGMPSMRMRFEFEDIAEGSRLTIITHLNSAEELQTLLAMQMLEGTREAMGQIDGVLAE